jgi:hypothetical protein
MRRLILSILIAFLMAACSHDFKSFHSSDSSFSFSAPSYCQMSDSSNAYVALHDEGHACTITVTRDSTLTFSIFSSRVEKIIASAPSNLPISQVEENDSMISFVTTDNLYQANNYYFFKRGRHANYYLTITGNSLGLDDALHIYTSLHEQ